MTSNFRTNRKEAPRINAFKALTLVTNSTDVAAALSGFRSSIQVIMLGGRLRKETQAFAGPLARSCIKAWNLHFDICMVGVLGVQSRKQFLNPKYPVDVTDFMSDTLEEAETKQALFERDKSSGGAKAEHVYP
jgi:DeoR/GlpR family transcriptional regulator of sugar metabolism